MANKNDNLIPGGHKLTLEEQSNGGKKSGEARREKATMKKTLELMLEEIGDRETGLTNKQLATLGLIKGAILQESNETPSVQINIVDNSNLEGVMYDQDTDKS